MITRHVVFAKSVLSRKCLWCKGFHSVGYALWLYDGTFFEVCSTRRVNHQEMERPGVRVGSPY
jgi:hypothetical protein